MKKITSRSLSLLLAVCMLLSMTPVTALAEYSGGIAGGSTGSEITNSSNTGETMSPENTDPSNAGGIVGGTTDPSISDSYYEENTDDSNTGESSGDSNTGESSGGSSAGGILGGSTSHTHSYTGTPVYTYVDETAHTVTVPCVDCTEGLTQTTQEAHAYTDGFCLCGAAQELTVTLDGENILADVYEITVSAGQTVTMEVYAVEGFYLEMSSVTIGGEVFMNFVCGQNTVTIPGEYVTGDIVIGVNGCTIDIDIPCTYAGVPTFTWAEDYSAATASWVCIEDGNVSSPVDCTVTAETEEATCTADGKITYTAAVTLNGYEYTDVQTITLPAGHNIDSATGVCSGCQHIYAARIGDTFYDTLPEAIDAANALAQAGQTGVEVTLLNDATLTESGSVYQNVTLTINEGVTLTLDKTLNISGTLSCLGTVEGEGSLSLDSVAQPIAGGTFYCAIDTADIDGGTFYGRVRGSTITGGTFYGTVYNQVTISGGTFCGPVCNYGTISGGTFADIELASGTLEYRTDAMTVNGEVEDYGTAAITINGEAHTHTSGEVTYVEVAGDNGSHEVRVRCTTCPFTLYTVTSEDHVYTEGCCVRCGMKEYYDIWVNGVQADYFNASDVLGDGTVSYTPAVGTQGEEGYVPAVLTLTGAQLLEGVISFDTESISASIFATGDLNLRLEGDSTVSSMPSEFASVGILVGGALTVSGSGSLTVSSAEAGQFSYAIMTSALTMEQGVTVAPQNLCVVYGGGVTYSGTFNALVGTGNPPYGYEVYGNVTLTEDMTITRGDETSNQPVSLTVMEGATLTVSDGVTLTVADSENATVTNNGAVILEGTGTIVNNAAGTCGEGATHPYSQGTCLICNSDCTHTGGSANCSALAVCELCGLSYGELGDHTGGTATCTEPAVCELCGQSYGAVDPLNHTSEEILNGFYSCCGGFEEAKLNDDGIYEIGNAGQLYWYAAQVNGGNTGINGKLTADIVVNEALMSKLTIADDGAATVEEGVTLREWTPIGTDYNTIHTGSFDGCGNTVSGLYFNNSAVNNVGLFGYTKGYICNVTVTDSYLFGMQNVAGIAGLLGGGGIVENCANSAVIVSSSTQAGGIVGNHNGTIRNCHNSGSITGALSYIGGVVGWAYGTVENSYNTGDVHSALSIVGGVTGCNSRTMINCYSTGNVTSDSTIYIGGVAGQNNGTLTNCYYLTGTAAGGINGGDVEGQAEAKSAEQFASGEVTWLLNGSTDTPAEGETLVWYQNLDNGETPDAAPVLSSTHGTVHYGYVSCAADAEQTYTNLTERPAHSYVLEESWSFYGDGAYVSVTATCGACGDTQYDSGNGTLTASYEGTSCQDPSTVTYSYTVTVDGVEHTFSETFNPGGDPHIAFDGEGFCTACGGYQTPEIDPGEYAEDTWDDTYLIYNAGQLYWFADHVNNDNNGIAGKLMNDINVNPGYTFNADGTYTGGDSPRAWMPIGDSGCYAGNFNGSGFTVSGLYCVSQGSYVGLFGYTDYNYSIKNIGISNSYFEGKSYVGALSGCAYSIISNCYADSTVTVVGSYPTGGLVGYNGSEISNSLAMAATVAGGNYGTFTNCYFLSDTEDEYDGTTAVTAEVLESGEVAWLLQSGVTGESYYDEETGEWLTGEPEQIWGQTIGQDAHPVLNGDTVYQVTDCQGQSFYSNTNASNVHSYDDGCDSDCNLCGEVRDVSHAGSSTYVDNADDTHTVTYSCCGTAVTEDHTWEYTASGRVIDETCSKCEAQGGTLTVSAPTDPVYDGNMKIQSLSVNRLKGVSYGDATFVVTKDGYTYATNVPIIDAGAYTISATVKGVTATSSFTIEKADITHTAPTPILGLTYSAAAQELVSAGSADGFTMEYSLDGTLWSTEIPTGTNAGTYTVLYRITGDNNHNDVEASVTVTVAPKSITAEVTVAQGSYVYNGAEHTPTVTVSDGSTVIDESEYTVSYINNVDPGTATVNIEDKEGGNYTVSGSATFTIQAEVIEPSIKLQYPTLTFREEVLYNIYYSVEGMEDVALTDMGLILFDSPLTDGTLDDASQVIPGAAVSSNGYMVSSYGIPAKEMGDTIYFRVYARLADGSYVYSETQTYCAVTYAENILGSDSADSLKALVVAMLNYGTEAQLYFGYNTDSLMNAGLTAEQQALVADYSADMIAPVVQPDASKLGAFASTGSGFARKYPTVSFEGAFAINYYFTPSAAVDGDMTLYYWTAADYAAATELTADNATGMLTMTGEGEYHAQVSGIAAKDLDGTVYVAVTYSDGETTHCSGVLAYSIGSYCMTQASMQTPQQSLAMATAVYGSYAKSYFNGNS